MAHDGIVTHQKLSALWQRADVPLCATRGERYAILSDMHLGDGGRADDARSNEKTIVAALRYYNKKRYNLILLGDIEEFWQFDLTKIVDQYHDTIYKAIKAFGDGRVYRVFGNHDLDWHALPDPVRNDPARFASATEAIKMRDGKGSARIILVHGHQGDAEAYKHPWRSRFFVRLYKMVEPYIKIDYHKAATQSQIVKQFERTMYSWAKRSRAILICGHSHRAIFASKSYAGLLREEIAQLQEEMAAHPLDTKLIKKNTGTIAQLRHELRHEGRQKRDIDPAEPRGNPLPCYFNAGCALYTDGITALEIADGELRLIKWYRDTRRRPPFQIYARGSLSAFSKAITE
jgi:UDP-2,3-diacylglucosamine pyrophosphatase LpxH